MRSAITDGDPFSCFSFRIASIFSFLAFFTFTYSPVTHIRPLLPSKLHPHLLGVCVGELVYLSAGKEPVTDLKKYPVFVSVADASFSSISMYTAK